MRVKNLISKFQRHGLRGSIRVAWRYLVSAVMDAYYRWTVRGQPEFKDPNVTDWAMIEQALLREGVPLQNWSPDPARFAAFQAKAYFPEDYHGGVSSFVWTEKLLEHWLAAELLGLHQFGPQDVYVDIAAGSSPWAKILRERMELSSFAIDLAVGPDYQHLDYYRQENATHTSFRDASVKGASLQCAYEMFMRSEDVGLLEELARVLVPGGKAVILPLYLHTHYCCYASPEYYGKGNADHGAAEYVSPMWKGIPSARFYSAEVLKARVLSAIERLGMQYRILVLRNKDQLGENIYCHFILEITK